MPFDGVVVKCIAKELSDLLVGSRIEKIYQPEADEIFINIRSTGQNHKLVMSASASYPRIHITGVSKDNPATPPVFCMLLRKHISGGRILAVEAQDSERIISIHLEAVNELGDLTTKSLIIEIMGRHSNIILVNSENKIIDSIKHVDNEISSVREIMPARQYELPPAQNKTNPEKLDIDSFINNAINYPGIDVEGYLLNNIKGFSPPLCREICFRSNIDNKAQVSELSLNAFEVLKNVMKDIISKITTLDFSPCIIFDDKSPSTPVDFHCLDMQQRLNVTHMSSMSNVLDTFYSSKDLTERLKQKKSDVLKALNNSISRCNKKIALQQDILRDVADREKLKLFGELITANIYCIPGNLKSVSLLNYYSENNEYIEIPLDENLTPQENAQKYFKRYTKAKNTFVNTEKQLNQNFKELEYLESVMHPLESCRTLQEIDEVRQELIEQGYVSAKKIKGAKKKDKPTAPLLFKSSDGIDIFVGKNNRQNDLLTLKMASSNDMWLHTRNIPGSHVIVKKLQQNIPDSTLLEAAILAACHSKSKNSSNVPVDYTTVKNVKKPHGAKPGMVIYENFKTIIVTPDEEIVKKLKT